MRRRMSAIGRTDDVEPEWNEIMWCQLECQLRGGPLRTHWKTMVLIVYERGSNLTLTLIALNGIQFAIKLLNLIIRPVVY